MCFCRGKGSCLRYMVFSAFGCLLVSVSRKVALHLWVFAARLPARAFIGVSRRGVLVTVSRGLCVYTCL